ncbi:hypothetical protein [Synechococcus phage Ssp-JY39]|nr:hypothetical protein [Synechococcus phage Yong-M2-251]
MIDPPKSQDDYADRLLDCEAAMETMFQTMIEEMAAVGWNPDEIERAAFKLIWAHRRTRFENAKVEAELAIMRAMERARR